MLGLLRGCEIRHFTCGAESGRGRGGVLYEIFSGNHRWVLGNGNFQRRRSPWRCLDGRTKRLFIQIRF